MNVLETALNEEQTYKLAQMGVQLFRDKTTNEVFVNSRWWNSANDNQKERAYEVVLGDNSENLKINSELDYQCTDIGNSERFIAQNINKVKYVQEWRNGWVLWDGSRWKPAGDRINHYAKKTAKSIYSEIRKCKTKSTEYELSKWARQSQFGGRLSEMLKLSKDQFATSIEEFDQDEYKINCKNGYLDLKSGELAVHSPNMNLMKRADVSYRPEAKCPLWEKFIGSVFQHDEELIDWIQRVLGYLLTGSVAEQQYYIMHGNGENGKGVLNDTLMYILGDYACVTQSDIFLNSNTSNARSLETIGRLKGIRFAMASEVGSASRWSEEAIKMLTGGDRITGASMYSARFDFIPSAKFVFQVNHLPRFRDMTHGFKRRVRVIPFKATFSGESRDKYLKDKLYKERDGIFNWLVDGVRKYLEKGLDDLPSVVRDATDQYIEDNDTLSPFIKAELVKEVGAKCYVNETYQKYVDWCRRNETEATTKDLFVKRMEERDIYRGKRDMKGIAFLGYKLRVTTYIPPAVATFKEPEALQLPVSDAPLVRTFLDEHGFVFEDEQTEVLFS